MAKRGVTPEEKKASRLSRRSRVKGKMFEKQIAQLVADWLGVSISDVVNAGSDSGIDLRLSDEARERLKTKVFWECKNHKTLHVTEWLTKMERQVKDTEEQPVLVFKMHGDSTPYAAIRFEFLMDLMTRHLVGETHAEEDS